MDWMDIILHIIIAVLFITLGGITGYFILSVILNTLFWPIREAWQHHPNCKEIITHPQSLLEWVAPVVFGFIQYGALKYG